MTTRGARLALSLVVEPGDPRVRDLLSLRSPEEVVDDLRSGHGRLRLPAAWRERARELDGLVTTATERARSAGLRWLVPGQSGWPPALDDLDAAPAWQGSAGAPLGLWVRGGGSLADVVDRSVAVVGARACTTYGAEAAHELAADLASGGLAVVSGGAHGIDGCAHRGALTTARPTVAVLACGADLDYPRSHAALLGRVAESGLVVSEQAPGSPPMKGRFLSRNRIIAGLSRGTVVVEAARRSGSLNTLHWADLLGRPTMAVPGPVTSRQSMGTHAALRAGEAVLVTSAAEVLEEVEGLASASTEVADDTDTDTAFDRLPPEARRTLDGLDWSHPLDIDALAALVRLGRSDVERALDRLVEDGFAQRAGSGWVLVRRADVVS